MYNSNVGNPDQNHEKISDKLEQVSFNSVRKVLPDNIICKICKDIGYKYRYRMIDACVKSYRSPQHIIAETLQIAVRTPKISL